ncbi:hypothetical protein Q7C36_012548 [Tachysurus vachellii]|uniref:Cell cycle checkpoint control protein n=1 Tax=Tachysurus vachellii TaxID=175792 RepID=A0AA88MPL2_TACVA|nr:hypothetical protein Q7C36_012548 [Tachysurus vachellii]
MKCVIEGNGVKVFGKAVHALSRISDDIWLDPLEKGLALRTVNQTHSAYACFLFSRMFFRHYTSTSDQRQEYKSAKCKVSLKSVLPLFRSISTLERSVYRCEITINIFDHRVVFQFKCRNDRIMYTEMFLHPDEFDYFHLRVDSDITFCLKELRGLLTFAESHGLQVSVHFGSSGNLEDMLLEAVVVLATLVDPGNENPSQVSVAQEVAAHSLVGVSLNEGPASVEATNVTVNHPVHSAGDQVASSQGSPFFKPTFHVKKLMQLVGGGEDFTKSRSLNEISSGPALSTAVTPASFKICSLLFGAVTNDQEETIKSDLTSLVYASDTEDDTRDSDGRKEE